MIVVTGAAGFIGSNMVKKLNDEGFFDIILVDNFSNEQKNKNLTNLKFSEKVDRNDFSKWLDEKQRFVNFIFHIGARSDTTGFDKTVYDELNLNYSKMVWDACVKYGLPMIYASSAATYGLGEHGYADNHELVDKLTPLNLYGESKNNFDKWALKQSSQPYFWAGLKYFNVYGPNEYHKGRMASVVLHTFKQINESGKMKLFRSHNPNFKDGEQLRDFVYVKDVVDVMFFLMNHRKNSGLYNIGTGQARSFNDLAINTFKAMGKQPDISYIDTPIDIRDKYQYFTEAKMEKLRAIGYTKEFTSLEEGIDDYVKNYLLPNRFV